MRNLDMTTLRSFLAVAEQGGVTRAASALNLTQSAVSMQLKRLEELLDIALLDRTGRKVALTGAGEQLLTYARRMVELNDEAVGRLTDDVYEGEVVLGVPHDVVYPMIPRVLKRFSVAFPRVKVQLISSYTSKLREDFDRGAIDLILTTEPVLGPGGRTLIELPLRWYGAPGGIAWRQRPLRLAYCRQCSFRPQVIEQLEKTGIDWEMAVDADSDRSVEAALSADIAVSALLEGHPHPFLEPVDHGGALPEVKEQKINLYCRNSPQDRIAEYMAEMIEAEYRCMGRPPTPHVRERAIEAKANGQVSPA